ncbi:DnaA regulatory inactivator HdaA [Daeguia caeni]|uniref:DnaA regulatory inactivator HdaA n=1 Tax=Daeguia caeni TaxID=439612 RepID=A0ABV9H5G7_9HYPH
MGAVMREAPRQIPLDLEHQPAYRRDDLIVTEANRAAVDIVDRWPDWLSPVTVLSGPIGAGKTHLAEIWRERTGALRVDAAHIDEAAVLAAAEGSILIEDIGDAPFSETGLFHIINTIRQSLAAGKANSLLMTSRQSPANWPVTLPDLASRLKAATVVEIEEPDDLLLFGVIHKLFADRQVSVEPQVVSYMIGRMERSLSAAIRLVDRLDRMALEQKTRISRALAAQALAEEAQNAQDGRKD